MCKKNQLCAAIIALMMIVASCGKDEEPVVSPSLELDKTEIAATQTGGSYTITVTSNVAWTAVVNPIADWCTLTPAAGEGNGTVTVTIAENAAPENRTATLTVAAGELSKTVTVTQTGASPSLEVDETEIAATNTGGSYTITVTSNVPWTAGVNAEADWCTLTPAAGEGNGSFVINVAANAGDLRLATVTVSATGRPELFRTISLEQAAAGELGVTIAGVTWATRNVAMPGYFANSPGDAGEYYQWGRNEPGVDAAYLPASGNWSQSASDPCPTGWRLPTEAEILTLTGDYDMTISWRDADAEGNYGTAGLWFGENAAAATAADPQGCIFLPAAGYINPDTGEKIIIDTDGLPYGYYYSGTENQDYGATGYIYLTLGAPSGNFEAVSTYFILGPGLPAFFGFPTKVFGYTLRCVKQD